MTRLLFTLVATAAVLTFASACGAAGGGIQTASPSAQAPSPAGTAATITFEGRSYTAMNAIMWFGPESLEPAGSLDPGDGGPPLQVYRFKGGPAGAITTQQTAADGGGYWQYWAASPIEGGGQSAPGAPPGSVPGALPGEATPTVPDNPAPPPGDVISATVSPAEGTATAGWATVGPGIPWPQPSPPDPIPAARAARDALAQHLGMSVEALMTVLTTVSTEFVEWPDGCLGLGEPNEPCIAMMIPGFRVALTAGGVQYVYRTDAGGGRLRLEAAASPPAPAP